MDVNNYFLRHSLWPAVLYTIVVLIIGIVGNGLVLIIYRKDYRKSVTWIFIYYLSVLDFLSCMVSIPAELVILFNIMSFPSVAYCKISRFLSYLFHGSSCVVLMFIAFNRYDRVCRLGNQWLNLRKAKIICVCVFIFVCVMDSPAAIFYGDAKVFIAIQDGTARFINNEDLTPNLAAMNISTPLTPHTQDPTANEIITGHMCLIESKYSGNIFALFFMLIQFLMYITLVVLVIFFYTKVIWKMVGYRARQAKLFKLYTPQRDGSIKEETSDDHLSEDVRSQNSGKDYTSDPLSTSSHALKRTNSVKKETEAVCENPTSEKPMQDTDQLRNHEETPKSANGLDLNFSGSNVETGNDNDLGKPTDPLNANKLLSRRIRSVEVLNKTLTPIPQLVIPNVDINGSSDNPLFLHASKTQKKRGKYESERRDDTRQYASDDQILGTRDDLYLHKQSQLNGTFSKSMEMLSPSVKDPLNTSVKTMTLNRRSPKGSSQCVLPVSGLSVKTATTYDGGKVSSENINTPPDTGSEFLSGTRQKQDKPNNDHPKVANKEDTDTSDAAMKTSPQANSGHSGTCSVSSQVSKSSIKRRMHGHGKKKLVSQPSVTFSVKDSGDEDNGKSPRTRSKRLDSMSPLFDTPERSSPFRRTRADSLFSPSEKTIGYSRRMSIKPIKALRTSSMLLIISLAFILSFLPFWIIVIWRAVVGESFMTSLTPVTFGLFSFFVRSSLVSNAVNPIVYGLINNQFRKRCKAIFQRK